MNLKLSLQSRGKLCQIRNILLCCIIGMDQLIGILFTNFIFPHIFYSGYLAWFSVYSGFNPIANIYFSLVLGTASHTVIAEITTILYLLKRCNSNQGLCSELFKINGWQDSFLKQVNIFVLTKKRLSLW